MMRKSLLLLLLTLVLTSQNACAWGYYGHRYIAYMAYQHLTPSTKAFLDCYLDQNIMQYSTWMDRYTDSPRLKPAGLHHMGYISADGSVPENHKCNSITTVQKSIDILSDWRNQTDSTVHDNIVYLIHLIADMHCPSHVYLEELGDLKTARNKIWAPFKFDGKVEKSYHYFWDSSINRLYPGLTVDGFVEKFDTWDQARIDDACKGTVFDWARDNKTRIIQIFDWYTPEAERSFLTVEHGWIVEEQASRAAYRMAKVFNDLFDGEK